MNDPGQLLQMMNSILWFNFRQKFTTNTQKVQTYTAREKQENKEKKIETIVRKSCNNTLITKKVKLLLSVDPKNLKIV